MFHKALLTTVLMTSLFAALCASANLAAEEAAQTKDKVSLSNEADIPKFEYTLTNLPSVIVFGDGRDLAALQTATLEYADRILQNYKIEDQSANRDILLLKHAALISAERWEDALVTTKLIRESETKEASRQTRQLPIIAYSKARLSSNNDSFATEYERQLDLAYQAVDLSIARDNLEQALGVASTLSTNLYEAALKSQIDKVVEQTSLVINRGMAATILGVSNATKLIPHKELISTSISKKLDSEAPEKKQDLWAKRVSDDQSKHSVLIGVWDTGIDPVLLGTKVWKNPDVNSGGSQFGIAFDENFKPENRPLSAKAELYKNDLDQTLDILKGALDLSAGQLRTTEAKLYQEALATLTPETMGGFSEKMSVLSSYVHGSHVADTAATGISNAKVMNIRFSWPTDPIPVKPIDEDYARNLVRTADESISFMKKNGVKVVNMSWRITRSMIDGMLLSTGAETDTEKRNKRATEIFDIMQSGLTEAFNKAPEILFVAGAGNEDENVEFVQSVPAGLNLQNLITVGAVDHTLEPTSFTSYGASIDLYANGFEIPGKVPGGRTLKLSGTSMAAPQVTNLAAHIWSILPTATVSDVLEIMNDSVTVAKDSKLKVIHPKLAVEKAINISQK